MPVKKLKKWNPHYTKLSVKIAMQNAFMKEGGFGDLTESEYNIINMVLAECDEIAKEIEDAKLEKEEKEKEK